MTAEQTPVSLVPAARCPLDDGLLLTRVGEYRVCASCHELIADDEAVLHATARTKDQYLQRNYPDTDPDILIQLGYRKEPRFTKLLDRIRKILPSRKEELS